MISVKKKGLGLIFRLGTGRKQILKAAQDAHFFRFKIIAFIAKTFTAPQIAHVYHKMIYLFCYLCIGCYAGYTCTFNVCRCTWYQSTFGVKGTSYVASIWRMWRQIRQELSHNSTSYPGLNWAYLLTAKNCSTSEGNHHSPLVYRSASFS